MEDPGGELAGVAEVGAVSVFQSAAGGGSSSPALATTTTSLVADTIGQSYNQTIIGIQVGNSALRLLDGHWQPAVTG